MTDYNIYAEQLFPLTHGFALYDADPGDQYDRVRPGDVGHIEYGKFIRTFNIFFPVDHPINNRGVPENFEELMIDQRTDINRRVPIPPGVLHSKSVKTMGLKLDASGMAIENKIDVELSCSKQQGAALLIRYQAFPQDALPRLKMEKYFLTHYENWLVFIRDVLGRNVKLSEIVLVTGCDLTADWAASSFTQKSTDAKISFQVGYAPVGSVQFSFWARDTTSVSVSHRKGPNIAQESLNFGEPTNTTHASNSDLLNIDDRKFNQCVFIRGYRVKERFKKPKIEELKMKAAAGYDKLPDRKDDNSSSGSGVVTQMQLTTDLMDFSDLDIITEEHDKNLSVYDTVLDHILERSGSKVALIHDEDIFPFLSILTNINELKTLSERGCVYTESKEDNVILGRIGHGVQIHPYLKEESGIKDGLTVPTFPHHLVGSPGGLSINQKTALEAEVAKDQTQTTQEISVHTSSAMYETTLESQEATELLNKIWTQHTLLEDNVKNFKTIHTPKRRFETSQAGILEEGSTTWSGSETTKFASDVEGTKLKDYILSKADVETWLAHVNKSVKYVGNLIDDAEYAHNELGDFEEMEEEKISDEAIDTVYSIYGLQDTVPPFKHSFQKRKEEVKVETNDEEQEDQQVEQEPEEQKRPPGACARCKSLKVKCDFKINPNICKRCLNGNHECVIPGRKKRRAPPKREHLLNKIRDQHAEIEKLMKELEAANSRTRGRSGASDSFSVSLGSPSAYSPHLASTLYTEGVTSPEESGPTRPDVAAWIARAKESMEQFSGIIGGAALANSGVFEDDDNELENLIEEDERDERAERNDDFVVDAEDVTLESFLDIMDNSQ